MVRFLNQSDRPVERPFRPEDALLQTLQIIQSATSDREQREQFVVAERPMFRSALDFHEASIAGHDDVEVDTRPDIFDIVEVENRSPVHDADTDGRHTLCEDLARIDTEWHQRLYRIDQGDKPARDAQRPRAAIGLQHVAVDRDRAWAEGSWSITARKLRPISR